MSTSEGLLTGVKKLTSAKSSMFTLICTLVCSGPLIIAVAVILALFSGDCDTPLRLWLMVFVAVQAWAVVTTLLKELFSASSVIARLQKLNIGIVGIFSLVWFIMGNIWYYGALDCSDFQEGSDLVFAILIIYYIGLGLVCCAGTCFVFFICCASCFSK
jgi:hypothetical protein